jgi:hypothetical protein
MFFVLLCFARSAPLAQLLACSIYQDKNIRLDYADSACLNVTDCFFQNLEATDGGAILVSVSNVSVKFTTFFACRASLSGGALYHSGAIADLGACCFREDQSGSAGNAMSFDSGGDCQLTDCSVLACAELDEPSRGGISNEAPYDFFLTHLNFSDCGSSISNIGIILMSIDAPWTFSECTVVRCSGFSGLQDSSATSPIVTLSNFYNNSFEASGCLLAGVLHGFDVDRCIFIGNTVEFYKMFYGAVDGFSVTNCVFSGLLPSNNIYKATANNRFETTTASFAFLYFATELCPNAMDETERTPAESPLATGLPEPTRNQPIVLIA